MFRPGEYCRSKTFPLCLVFHFYSRLRSILRLMPRCQYKNITSLCPFNLVNGVGGKGSQVHISHEWNWFEALVILQEITMHVELTHQVLDQNIMDSYNYVGIHMSISTLISIVVDR